MHEKPCLYETKCVIMKGREYSSVYQVQFEKKKFEACYVRRFSQIMKWPLPNSTVCFDVKTSFSPLSLSHKHSLSNTHIFFLGFSPGLLMARNAVAANHNKLSSHMTLPEMLREAHICKHCPYLPQCCLAHK